MQHQIQQTPLINVTRYWHPPKPLTGNIFAYGRIGCLDEDTKIKVYNDMNVLEDVKIKDLDEEFDVESYNDKTGFFERAHAEKHCSGKKLVYEILFSDKTKILATKDHVFFIGGKDSRGKELNGIEVKDLKKGDILFGSNETIISINKYKRIKTYDIYVIGNHNFLLSNGILSHNSGKSCKLLAIAQYYHSNNYKIWDVFGGKRHEGLFWVFPNDDKKLWAQMEHDVGIDFRTAGPKEYEVNIATPLFSKSLPKRLPENKPRIKHKIFTIPFQDMTEDDASLVLGPLSNRDKMLFERLKEYMPKNGNGEDLTFLMNTKFKKAKQHAFYSLFLKPLIDNHFISSKNSELNLDLEEEAKKVKEVFVLNLEHVPQKFWFFIMGNILRRLFNLVKENKVHKKNLTLFREASLFMKVVDSDKNKEETAQIFRNLIVDIARYARSGLFEALDTQDSCLEENTKIKVLENNKLKNKKIKDIGKNPTLMSYNFKKKKFEKTKGINVFEGEQDVYEIELEDGRKILATREHKFFKNKKRVYVKNLKPGDDIICQENLV